MRTRNIVAVPLLAGALTLAACGGSGTPGPGSSDSGGPTLAPITAQDINAQDPGSLKKGGELKLAIGAMPENWNIANVNGNEGDIRQVMSAVTPNWLNFDAKGNYTPDPAFLTTAEVTSQSPTTVHLVLNNKAVWGDGSPVDADDLIANWKACNGENKKFQCASTDGWDQIASITTGADKFDITVTFKKVFPDWASVLSGTLKAETQKDPDTFNNGFVDGMPVANQSGPFKIDKVDKTQQTITLVPNDKWWGTAPVLDKITFKAISIEATPNAFVNHEIDSFDIGPDPNGYKLASGVSGAAVRKAAGPNFRHITFNIKNSILSDIKVRQAIVEGLDRGAVGDSDLAGIDWPSQALNNNILLQNQAGYEDMAQATGIGLNVEKAKSDLDALGWKIGSDGYREKDGKKLEFGFSALTGVPVSQNEGLQFQAQMKDIGVKVNIIQTPTEKFSSTLSGKSFDTIAFTWSGTPFPFANINQIYGTGSESNYSQCSLPEVDKIAGDIKVEPDQAKRIAMANQAAKVLWENVCTLPLYQRPDLIGQTATLANFGAFGLGSIEWAKVGFQNG